MEMREYMELTVSWRQDIHSLQGALAGLTGLGGMVIGIGAANTLETSTVGQDTQAITGTAERQHDSPYAELGGALVGFPLAAVATYIGIRRLALRYMTWDEYIDFKRRPLC